MASRPEAFLAMKMASLILRPEWRFLDLTSFQRRSRPTFSFGSSSLISRFRQSLSFSFWRLRPPGNIHRPSRRRLTSRTRPRFAATSFDDFAICLQQRLCEESYPSLPVFAPNTKIVARHWKSCGGGRGAGAVNAVQLFPALGGEARQRVDRECVQRALGKAFGTRHLLQQRVHPGHGLILRYDRRQIASPHGVHVS